MSVAVLGDRQTGYQLRHADQPGAQDLANFEFARWLKKHQKRIRPPLSQSQWARDTGRYGDRPITTSYLNRVLNYEDLYREGNWNRVNRVRGETAVQIIRPIEEYLREDLVEQGLRILGFEPSHYIENVQVPSEEEWSWLQIIREIDPEKREMARSFLETLRHAR